MTWGLWSIVLWVLVAAAIVFGAGGLVGYLIGKRAAS